MPEQEMNWDAIDEQDDYSPVPDGRYLCKLIEAKDVDENGDPITTQYNDEMWKLKFEIIDGEHKGRAPFWDNLIFSKKTFKRVKFICSRLGVETKGTGKLKPEMLLDKEVWITTKIKPYESSNGEMKKKNDIPWAGYERVNEGDLSKAESISDDEESNMPF